MTPMHISCWVVKQYGRPGHRCQFMAISQTCSHYFLIYFAVAIIMNVMTKDFTILEIVQLFKLVIFCVLCVLKASILFFFSPWAMRQVTGWETREDDMQGSSWSAAVRTQPLHMGCTLYHLSYSGTQNIFFYIVLFCEKVLHAVTNWETTITQLCSSSQFNGAS